MRELRQSTVATVKIGPFVDASDGVTEETALVITQADIKLSKNGGTLTQKSESSTSPHDSLGCYTTVLDIVDTNTLGGLRLECHKVGALPVWEYYMIVTTNYYDAKYSSELMNVTTAGTGNTKFDYYMYEDEEDETDPITNCYVWVSTDLAGTNIVASGYTNTFGKVEFWLDTGTYYFWRSKSGFRFTNPDIEVVG